MKTKLKKVFIQLLALIFFSIAIGGSCGAILALFQDLPQIIELENFQPSEVTRIYSSDNRLMAELYLERRHPVPLSEIPDNLVVALLTTEDRQFYNHSGVDIKGIARAIIKDIIARKFVEGASTLTQQLAKTLFLSPEKKIIRKIKEAVLALQLERKYTKQEIIGLYLNQVYFGSGAYGVQAAARTYFNKPVSALNLSECALIAGLPKAPSYYSPNNSIARAIQRRNIVLKQMLLTKAIDKPTYDSAVSTPLKLHAGSRKTHAPFFIDHVKKQLEESLGPDLVYKGGLSVYTTLNLGLQEVAEKSVQRRMQELDTRMKKNGITDPSPECAVFMQDLKTGGIIVMVGGRDFETSNFNRSTMAKRQPGSAFKPFIYAAAIEKKIPQNMLILDRPVAFSQGPNQPAWKPQNFSKNFSGEMTLRKALSKSQNIPAIKLCETLGTQSIARIARDLGIKTPISPYLSMSLGTSEVYLSELTTAYGAFPNQGRHISPFSIQKVVDGSGHILWKSRPSKRIAMSRAGAAVMTNMLQAVVLEGTGRRAKKLHHPLGGKTGTTDDYKDALFVGFSPSAALGVWVGNDDNKTLGRSETGARAALPIWVDVMGAAISQYPVGYFDRPDDVVSKLINQISGEIAKGSETGVNALFIKGTEPGFKKQIVHSPLL